jgi:NAD(P)-dependent dehydrogenase (short-subunit alcohol dehydrogenase family)
MTEKKSGKIIVVSTRLAQQPLPTMGAYAAAKSALESMANTLAIELGPLGINVNVVTPAFTLTDASMIMPEAFQGAGSADPAAKEASLSRRCGRRHRLFSRQRSRHAYRQPYPDYRRQPSSALRLKSEATNERLQSRLQACAARDLRS